MQIEERGVEFGKATNDIELGVAAKEEEERAEKQRKKKFDDEMKLEKAKLEQKRKYEKKIDGKKDQNINAKLSKLVITKFKGIPTDWLCLTGIFHLRTEIKRVNRGVPLTLTNPWYKDILAKYDHLRAVEIDDVDLKST